MVEPYFDDGQVQLYLGDCREVLPELDLGHVGAVVADPPYGETSLRWDRWPAGWVDTVASAVRKDHDGHRLCGLPGCDGLHAAKGMCDRHYRCWRRTGSPWLTEGVCYLDGCVCGGKVHIKTTTRLRKRRQKPKAKPWSPCLPGWVDVARVARGPAEGWRERALCVDVEPAVFFPSSTLSEAYRRALAVCEGCPVRHDCVAENLTESHGCFGATPAQRTHVRKALAERSAA